ncbi:MAG: arginine decarboxylase, pyruvoyl-dependent [Candidatus Micrarchaeaceae archaeon]
MGTSVDPLLARKMFFVKGVGRDSEKLGSFEQALRDAHIQMFNLVRVSSIIPPNCEIVKQEEGFQLLVPGQVVFLVMSRIESNEPNRLIAASIGAAMPKDRSQYGYLSEYEAYGETDEVAGEKAEDLAATMLATTLGIEFDADQSWDEKEQVFKMSNKIVKTFNVTQSAVVGKGGRWTTAIAAAVLVTGLP